MYVARQRIIKVVLFLAMLCLAVLPAGCTSAGTSTEAPKETSTESDEPAHAQGEESNALTGEDLAYFNDEFFQTVTEETWGQVNIRLQFLSSLYDGPADINLYELFYNGPGVDVEEESISDQELAEVPGSSECPVTKISYAVMDAVLYENTGLHLEETNKVGLSHFTYLPEFDGYYSAHGDTNDRGQVVMRGGTREGDLVHLCYQDDFYGDGWKCVTLREQDGQWLFVSNALTEKPALETVYPEEAPWKIFPLKGLDAYEPQQVQTATRTNDCAERLDGWLTRPDDSVTVRTYRSTDGNTYAAVVDEELAKDDGSIQWTVHSFQTIPESAQFSSMGFFSDLFGENGLIVFYIESQGDETLQGTFCYYTFSADGVPTLLVQCAGAEIPAQWDLDGDGEDELIACGQGSGSIFYERDGAIYEANVSEFLSDALGAEISWDSAEFERNYRCLNLHGLTGASGLPQDVQVYFDGERLLTYEADEAENG